MKYLSKPANIYYELVTHPHAWVVQTELIIGAGSILLLLISLYALSMLSIVFLTYEFLDGTQSPEQRKSN